MWEKELLKAAVDQVLWCSPCPRAIQILPVPALEDGYKNRGITSPLLHVSSWFCSFHISFIDALIPFSTFISCFQLKPLYQIFKWSFPSQISRIVFYHPSHSAQPSLTINHIFLHKAFSVLHWLPSLQPFLCLLPDFHLVCLLKDFFFLRFLCFLELNHKSSFSILP